MKYKNKIAGVVICGIGVVIFVFILFFIFSIFSTFSGWKFFGSLLPIFLESKFLPPSGMVVLGSITFIFSLFSIALGLKFFPTVGIIIFGNIMLIFSLFSIALGLRFFPYSWLEWFYKVMQFLFLASGIIYLVNSIFLPRFKDWTRKLSIYCSSVLLFCFILFLIVFIPVPFLGGAIMLLISSIYICVPLFFILFLSRPKIKEQFKK